MINVTVGHDLIIKQETNIIELPFQFSNYQLPRIISYYVHRNETYNKINAKLHLADTSKEITLVVLNGMRGIGKTQTAREFINNDTSAHKLWFNAQSRELLLQEYKQFAIFAKRIKKDEICEDQVIIQRVKGYLEENPGWFIVYDDAESYRSISNFLPANGGKVLITSSHGSSEDWPEEALETIGLMQEAEAKKLVTNVWRKRVNHTDVQIDNLLSALGRLPLALTQASHYIGRKVKVNLSYSIDDYLIEYKKTRQGLLNNDKLPAEEEHINTWATVSLMLKDIRGSNPVAYKMLHHLAYIESNGLNSDWIKRAQAYSINEINFKGSWLKSALLGSDSFSSEDNEKYEEALRLLLDYSIIEKTERPGLYSTHPVLQDGFAELHTDQVESTILYMMIALNLEHPDFHTASFIESRRDVLLWLIHAEKLKKNLNVEKLKEMIKNPQYGGAIAVYTVFFRQLSDLYYSIGEIDKSLAAYQDLKFFSLSFNETELPGAYRNAIHYGYGRALKNRGRYHDAIAELKLALNYTPDDLMSLVELGSVYGISLNTVERKKIFKRIATLAEKRDYATNQSYVSLAEAGRLDEAVAFEICRAFSDLSVDLLNEDKYFERIEYLRISFNIGLSYGDKTDFQALLKDVANNLSATLEKLGYFELAKSLTSDLVRMRLQLNPKYQLSGELATLGKIHFRQGMEMAKKKKWPESYRHLQKAKYAFNNLAAIYSDPNYRSFCLGWHIGLTKIIDLITTKIGGIGFSEISNADELLTESVDDVSHASLIQRSKNIFEYMQLQCANLCGDWQVLQKGVASVEQAEMIKSMITKLETETEASHIDQLLCHAYVGLAVYYNNDSTIFGAYINKLLTTWYFLGEDNMHEFAKIKGLKIVFEDNLATKISNILPFIFNQTFLHVSHLNAARTIEEEHSELTLG